MVVEARLSTENPLDSLQFRYPLRRYQQEILQLVNRKLEDGEKQLHIVAPPGAGKTILGLQIISQLKCPSVILCPNTTIQSQWGQKLELFVPPELEGFGLHNLIGTHEDRPLKPITLLTYQVLSTPGREQEYLEKLAHQSWIEEMTKGLCMSAGDAELRIMEIMQNNKSAYNREMSRHVSRLRRRLTEVLDLNEVLHGNAIELLQALRRQNFRLVLFDECHHLTDYWAAVMTHLVKRLPDPVIIGLTGTPPEGKSAGQETRYLSLVGDIDYQVPTPALVKEGGLAPFQDLVYFTTPTDKEMTFLETQHEEFHLLLEELATPPVVSTPDGEAEPAPLSKWIIKRLASLKDEGWPRFLEREPELTMAMGRYIWTTHLPFPPDFELTEAFRQPPLIDDWMALLEDFGLRGLKTSSSSGDHKLFERIKVSIRKLGYGLTEQGLRRQASPVDRVLAFSDSKTHAAASILDVEYKSLQDRLRAVVVTDFERMAATVSKDLKGVLDNESGGAVAVMRELLASPVSQYVNPCLVTGSLLLTDKRITAQFLKAAEDYIAAEGFEFKPIVRVQPGQGFDEITAGTSEWETRLYVGMATAIFERGITKCLIGTRGIFGEGWDSQALNTLIDLTTATSPVSVKQLRGRSIRLNTGDPANARKVADNWDVVCIAPSLEKGLNDYQRFVRKHAGFFGISDDGQIECGAGHVHASFSELTPAEVFASADQFNDEMILRAVARDRIYDLWKVGQPYYNRALGCVEVIGLRKLALTPPHIRKDLKYKVHARHLRSELAGVWWEYAGLGAVISGAVAFLLSTWGIAMGLAAIPFALSLMLARNKFKALYSRLQADICQPNSQESSLRDIAIAVLASLQEMKLLPRGAAKENIKISLRVNGSYRVFLDEVEPEQSQYFARCFQEVMAPITNQPYLIPKYEYSFPRVKEEAEAEKTFFRAYLKGNSEPRIGSYHPVPKLLARSEKGREAFQASWNKYVSPGFIVATETKPELLEKYFGIGPSLAQRLLWE